MGDASHDAVNFFRCQLAHKFVTFIKPKKAAGHSQKNRNILSGKAGASFDVGTMRSTVSDFLQNFTVMFNQLQDFPMLNSKVFAMQMICLMKKVKPKVFQAGLYKKAQSLAGCCVFDNDFHFHELTEVGRVEMIPLQNDQEHILGTVLRHIQEHEADPTLPPPGPWVLELTANIQKIGGVTCISVVKYDTLAKEATVLCSARGKVRVYNRADLEKAVTTDEKTDVSKVFSYLGDLLDFGVAPVGDRRVSVIQDAVDEAVVGGQVNEPLIKAAAEIIQCSEPEQLFYVVYILRRSATQTDKSVKYNAIKNAFLQFSK